MKYPTLLIAALSTTLLSACPPNTGNIGGGGGGGGGGVGSGSLWLETVEMYEGEVLSRSHSLIHFDKRVTCNEYKDAYEEYTEVSAEQQTAYDELFEQYGADAWEDVEFVRDYCVLSRDYYQALASANELWSDGDITMLTLNHPDAVDNEPLEGTYPMAQQDDVPDGDTRTPSRATKSRPRRMSTGPKWTSRTSTRGGRWRAPRRSPTSVTTRSR
jgi:hypothetical protein